MWRCKASDQMPNSRQHHKALWSIWSFPLHLTQVRWYCVHAHGYGHKTAQNPGQGQRASSRGASSSSQCIGWLIPRLTPALVRVVLANRGKSVQPTASQVNKRLILLQRSFPFLIFIGSFQCNMGLRDAYYPLVITCLVVDGIAVGLRVWARSIKKAAGYDDFAMILSLVSSPVNCGLLLSRLTCG